jgi:hypothetical protein
MTNHAGLHTLINEMQPTKKKRITKYDQKSIHKKQRAEQVGVTCNWMLHTAQSKNLSSPTSLYILIAVCHRQINTE